MSDSSQIPYPANWHRIDRDAMDALFQRARANNLWFRQMKREAVWFSPDRLETEMRAGRYLWGPGSWMLFPPPGETSHTSLGKVYDETLYGALHRGEGDKVH